MHGVGVGGARWHPGVRALASPERRTTCAGAERPMEQAHDSSLEPAPWCSGMACSRRVLLREMRRTDIPYAEVPEA